MAKSQKSHRRNTRNFASKNFFDFTEIIQILKIVWRTSKFFTICRLILTLIQGLLPFIPLYLIKLILDAFAAPTRPTLRYLMILVGIFFLVRVVGVIITSLQSYVSMRQSDIINDEMSKIVITKAMNTDLEYFDSDVYHDIFSRALSQSSGRPIQILNTAITLIQNIVVLLAIIGLLITVHWSIIILLPLITLPVAVVRWIYTGKRLELVESQTQEERKSGYFKGVMTSKGYAKEVRIFNFGKELLPLFLGMRLKIRKEKRDFYVGQSIAVGFAQLFEAFGIIAALGYIVFQTYNGLLTIGDIALYFGILQKGQSAVSSFLRSFVSIQENKLFVSHLFQFLNLRTNIKRPRRVQAMPSKINTIEVENLSFKYPGTNKMILKNISLGFNKGEISAVVGENGSGKTTLLKLLSRLYDPNQGEVKINGINISQFKLADVRNSFSIIFQQFAKYNATVKENIYYSDILSKEDMDAITKSTELSKAREFIDDLPSSFDTQLGRSFRHGEELSGGQWQKMALARALFKNSDIIILDEPTSFIDPLAEEEIFKNLMQLVKERQVILILITHRIYNLKQCDNIIVMDNGDVIEQGTHSQLMTQEGRYNMMFNAQNN